MNRRRFFSAAGAGALAPLRARGAAHAPPPTPPAPLRMKVGCQEGPTNDEWLRFFARHGVRNICGSFPGTRPPGPYTVQELERLRELCGKYGVSLDMVRLPFLRPTSVDSDDRAAIVLGESPERDRDIAEIQATIRNCARAGVPAVSYNLTILGYQRNRTTRGRGGSSQSAWRLADGGEPGKPALTRAGQVNADRFWERITYFLDRVVPVAHEHKVRMACHPHDPPTPPGFRGVDSVLGTVDGLKRFITIKESPFHGLNFCQGTVAEMLAEPARELHDVIRYFGQKKKIFNVHFRNIHGHRDDFEERFPDDGDIDFAKVLKVYKEIGYEHMLMPDHVPKDPDDVGKRQALAFCYGYIRGLLHAEEA
jgi:mannonate dehydratase